MLESLLIMDINQINDYIIESLESFCKSNDPETSFKVSMPHVIHISEDEFSKINHSSVKYAPLKIAQLRFAVIEHNNSFYLYIIGTSNIEIENQDFIPADINNCLFLCIVKTAMLRIRNSKTVADITENIYPIEDGSDPGYELDTILQLFEPFVVYKVPEQDIKTEIALKTNIGKILLANQDYIYLRFSERTMGSFSRYFDNGNYDDNMFNSTLAYCWRYCFLDVYRCIEPFFRHMILYNLKNDIGYANSLEELYDRVAHHLNWKPNETTSMESLFQNHIPVELQQKIIDLNIGEAPDEKPGKSIYRLRNRIVHHQGVSSDIENLYTEDKWNLLVEYLIEAIIEFHKRFPLT